MTKALFREDSYLPECSAQVVAVGQDWIELDQTVFYPTGGGQPGDTGVLHLNKHQWSVVDTRTHRESGAIHHQLEASQELPKRGDQVTAVIDWERRYHHMRMHSCLHVLGSIITVPVTGGAIYEDRGRLDFALPDPPDREQLEAELNRRIQHGHGMSMRWISDTELAAQPELVRTMSVQPPTGAGRVRLVEFADLDLQPCGGTHVANTREIGAVKIAKIEKKGKQNRRITVVFA